MSARAEGIGDHRAEKAIERIKCPRLIRQLGKRELAPARQRVRCRGYHGERIIEQDFGAELVGQAADHFGKPPARRCARSIPGRVSPCRRRGHERTCVDIAGPAGRWRARRWPGNRLGRSDAYFPGRRVGEEVDILDTLAQVVEDRDAAFAKSKPIGRRRNPAPTAVNELHPERASNSTIALERRAGKCRGGSPPFPCCRLRSAPSGYRGRAI